MTIIDGMPGPKIRGSMSVWRLGKNSIREIENILRIAQNYYFHNPDRICIQFRPHRGLNGVPGSDLYENTAGRGENCFEKKVRLGCCYPWRPVRDRILLPVLSNFGFPHFRPCGTHRYGPTAVQTAINCFSQALQKDTFANSLYNRFSNRFSTHLLFF